MAKKGSRVGTYHCHIYYNGKYVGFHQYGTSWPTADILLRLFSMYSAYIHAEGKLTVKGIKDCPITEEVFDVKFAREHGHMLEFSNCYCEPSNLGPRKNTCDYSDETVCKEVLNDLQVSVPQISLQVSVPQISLHGTSKQTLVEELDVALNALRKAVEAVEGFTVHARDYPTLEAHATASKEQASRVVRLQSVIKEFSTIWEQL